MESIANKILRNLKKIYRRFEDFSYLIKESIYYFYSKKIFKINDISFTELNLKIKDKELL